VSWGFKAAPIPLGGYVSSSAQAPKQEFCNKHSGHMIRTLGKTGKDHNQTAKAGNTKPNAETSPVLSQQGSMLYQD
jgi:hypothetical protein